MPDLGSLLRPRSVAVIGASEDIRTYAGAPIHNLLGHGFDGAVYAVNPNRDRVQGLPCYRSVLDIPGEVETAVVVVPSPAVLTVLRECVAKGVRSATVVSSGFGEAAAGEEGQRRAAELQALIDETGIRILGPNSVGLVNLLDGYVPRAAHNQMDPDRVRPGGVALVTQSGACGNIVYNRAQAHGVGVGVSVATGDQIDVDVWQLCQFLLQDPRITILMTIVETLGDVRRFEQLALQAALASKLLLVLKLGRSEAGRRAVMTHSGSLAGDAAVQAAAMRQLGVVEVDNLDDLWQLAGLVERWGPPPARPGRLGVVAFSGGEGALIADHCARLGLELPPTSPTFAEFVKAHFAYAMASNPLDPSGEIVGHPEKVRLVLRAFMEQNSFSEVLIASPVLRAEQTERQLGEVGAILDPPRPHVCFSYWPAGDLTREQERILSATGQPVFAGSMAALRAISRYREAGQRRRRVTIRPEAPPTEGGLGVGARYFEVRAALESVGIPFAPAALVSDGEEAERAALAVGLPVVLKANVPSSVHKLANGLVALDVRSPHDARQSFARLAAAGAAFGAEGVVVEALGAGQVEVLIGAHRDPDFGAILLYGVGGIMVEHLDDVALAVARYLDPEGAAALPRSTRVGQFLSRRSPAALKRLEEVLLAVAEWFAANPQLGALDLNPLRVELSSGQVTCVDARIG